MNNNLIAKSIITCNYRARANNIVIIFICTTSYYYLDLLGIAISTSKRFFIVCKFCVFLVTPFENNFSTQILSFSLISFFIYEVLNKTKRGFL